MDALVSNAYDSSCATAIILVFVIPKAFELPVYAASMEVEICQRLVAERDLRDENEVMTKFRYITHQIRRTLDKDTVIRAAAIEICTTLAAERCLVYLPRFNKLRCVCEFISPLSEHDISLKDIELDSTQFLVRRALLDRSAIKISCGDAEFLESYGSICHQEGIAAAVLVRISIADNQHGLIVLLHGDNTRGEIERKSVTASLDWGITTLRLITDVAEQISIALQQALLIGQEQMRIKQLAEQNDALTQARKEMQFAAAQREFLAVMSHEMRQVFFAK
ncbi:mitochondrial 2-enoyl thioester reductase [Borealophlyctis nickersoniae]|nr:mitochondrial 2-enoyl thioester reductase [Borealophlyctis nickersoniae]